MLHIYVLRGEEIRVRLEGGDTEKKKIEKNAVVKLKGERI